MKIVLKYSWLYTLMLSILRAHVIKFYCYNLNTHNYITPLNCKTVDINFDSY